MRASVLPCLVLFAALLPGAASAQNLLTNPGFETGGTAPSGWSTWPPGAPGVAYVWSSLDPCSGSRCAEVSSTTTFFGMWRQELPVTGGALYTYSGWIETENVAQAGACTLQAVFRDAANAILEFVDLGSHDGTITPWMFDFPHVKRVRAPQGSAFDLPVEVPILDLPYLPPGTYTLFFCLDAADGIPQGTYADAVSVTVAAP